jgi:ferredoxin
MTKVTFITKEEKEITVTAREGESLLEIAQENDIELEGACNGACACATCHCIVDEDSYEILSKPSELEEELLDFAYGVTPTSRLGCQVRVTEKLDGIKVKIPA